MTRQEIKWPPHHWLQSKVPVTWLFAGDSITQGAVHTRGARDYTQLFKERLGELGRNEDIVINVAVGGWTLRDLELRLEERVLRFRPQVIFLMFGTNDAALGAGELSSFPARLETVVNRLEDEEISVLLQTPPTIWPVDPCWYGTLIGASETASSQKIARLQARLAWLPQFVEAIKTVAAAHPVPVVDHWEAWNRTGTQLGQLTDGAFHPNEYGHRLLAFLLFKAMGIADSNSWTCRLFIPADLNPESNRML